jgi:hypothetical protein
VLSRPVDVVEGLLLEEGSEAVLGSDFLDNLHDHNVLVDLGGVGSVKRGKFELAGGDFTVTSLERNSNTPALVLDFLHTSQGSSGTREGSHVVVAHFLSAGGVLSNNGSSGELKIGTAVVLISWDQEKFLLKTDVGLNTTGGIKTQLLEETASLEVKGSVGTEKRGLLIKSSSIVGNKGRRDENSVAAAENWRRGVNSEVSSSTVGSTKTTVGVGRTIGLTLGKSLSLEVLDNFIVLVELQHDVLNLSGQTVTDTAGSHRLEPVAVNIGTTIKGPVKSNQISKKTKS